MKTHLPLLLLLCAICGLAAQAKQANPQSDTASTFDATPGDTLGVADTAEVSTVRNPWLAGGLSLLFPGAGQIYNRRYIRGGLYAATEVGLVLYAINRYNASEKYVPEIRRLDNEYHRLLDSLGGVDTSLYIYEYEPVLDSSGAVVPDTQTVRDSMVGPIVYRMNADTARYKRDRFRYSAYQATWWAASCYIYALMDALEKTTHFYDDAPRDPTVAFWLSTIPGLGLGQVYNGELSKAGLVFMVQSSLGYMAYNHHRLMRRCEEQLLRIDQPGTLEHRAATELPGTTYHREWESMRKQAFRNRNTYLWYSIFFYFYGIFDAVVDAHLHDYDRRMRLEPDLEVSQPSVGMRLQVKF